MYRREYDSNHAVKYADTSAGGRRRDRTPEIFFFFFFAKRCIFC